MTISTLRFAASAPTTTPSDVLVIGISEVNKKLTILPQAITGTQGKKILTALLAVGATGKPGEQTRIPAAGIASAKSILAVGIGAEISTEQLRALAGDVTRSLAGNKKVNYALRDRDQSDAKAVAEGALLAAYAFTDFRKDSLADQKSPVASITVHSKHGSKNLASEISKLVSAIHFARDLGNTPPSHLPPAEFVARAKKFIASRPITATVWDEKKLVAEGFGGIIGVGQGSSRPPRLLKLEYKPKGAKQHLALIGKGITFDTGGISLKPGLNMHDMKFDMSGAGAVVAAVNAIADLGIKIHVTAWAALAENMPSGTASRPGDVLKIYGGKTVEVLNTDAEGRLVLADAIVKAVETKPNYLIDVATLTGAQVLGMGLRTGAIMANNDEFRTEVHNAAMATGEDMWPMPLPEFLRAEINSSVADLANIGSGKGGGMQLAGIFLREFVPKNIPWAHLDVAGPAYNQGAAYAYNTIGSTGFAIRTMVELARRISAR
jgi:leucyl aminopeptidase